MTVATRQIRTTNKGLITERHGLLFEPDASVDELNCELLVNQVRRRRRGVVYEDSFSLSSFTHTEGEVVQVVSWENVGGFSFLQYLVVQNGDTLYFYDKSSTPLSSGLKAFSVDLNDFDAGNDKPLNLTAFQGDSLEGVFVVVHEGCEPFYIEYDSDTDTISTTQIIPKVRDFDYLGNIDDYFTNSASATVSAAREYDTKNAGWDDDAIPAGVTKPLSTFVTNESAYPALTKAWYSGKNTSGLFSQTEWNKVWTGSSLSGNGHYVLSFFSKNREQYVTGAGVENESSRFSTVTAYAGRFWYAGLSSAKNSGKILFTRVIKSKEDYNRCYQIHDPTSEEISDLLDDDGGVINIPSAYGIKFLYEFGATLLVFAENGVWQIIGVDGVFKATEYSISKVTDFGMYSQGSFVEAGGIPFWWSDIGIHTVSANQISGGAEEQSLSQNTINTFWTAIDDDKKLQVRSTYDRENKKIYWMYPDNSETVDYKYNKLLILDLVNQAFLPWSISDQTTNTDYIVGFAYFPAFAAVERTQNVTVNGVDVTENSVLVTWTSGVEIAAGDSQIKLVCRDGDSGKFTFGLFGASDFTDWGTADFSSYFQLGHDLFDSLSVYKSPVTVVTYFNRTENGWTDNGDGSYTPTGRSSCLMENLWDFHTTSPTSQQVYRLKTLPTVDESALSTFNYPTTVVINRTTVKGNGRAMSTKFSSEAGKDFQFLGYELVFDQHDQL